MVMILLVTVAFMISGAAVTSQIEPVDRAKDQFELPQAMVGGAPITQSVRIEPYSELKFRHIVRQAYDYSCGSAALTTLLNYHIGVGVSERQAMEGMLEHGEKEMIVKRHGFSLLDMKRYVASLGLDSAGFRGEVKDLMELGQPAIVPIDYAGFKHFVVMRGIRNGLVYIADPAMGNFVFSVEIFSKYWDRNTLFVIYPPKSKPPAAQLTLTDKELGVFDMDRIKDQVDLQSTAARVHVLERAVNSGFGGVYVRRR